MSSLPNFRPVEIDALPLYSHWISYLLGLKSLTKPLDKSAESIVREYGEDKWGKLLNKLGSLDCPTVFDADRLSQEVKESPCYFEGSLYLANTIDIQEVYFNLIKDELEPLLEKSKHLVELGAGYGSIVLKLQKQSSFESLDYTIAEFTDTGIDCIKLLSPSDSKFDVGFCDLNNLDLSEFSIPESAIFMTSWTMACLKGFSRKTLNEIIKHKPSMVMHVEPIYEHWKEGSLLQMLWQRYCQLNDYNQSLLTALKEYETEGLIDIVEERKNVFGSNPLAPVSIVKWVPRHA